MESLLAFLKSDSVQRALPFIRRILVLVLFGFLLYLVRSQITLFLLTFIFIFLSNSAQKFLSDKIGRYIHVGRLPIVLFIYIVVLGGLITLICVYAPSIGHQLIVIGGTVYKFFAGLSSSPDTGNAFYDFAVHSLRDLKLQNYLPSSGKYVLNAVNLLGSFVFDLLVAVLLSFFFMIEKPRIFRFLARFKESRIRWLYEDTRYFAVKFTGSFGKVMQAQLTIAFINATLSLILFTILGFPNLIGLFFMVFILGLVPVLGVFISLVPLTIIAYNVGGANYIVCVLILIAVLHVLESYVLNPKLMSNTTKLPVFFTFLTLILSEHFFGIWGLIVGIPTVMFLLDLLEVKMES